MVYIYKTYGDIVHCNFNRANLAPRGHFGFFKHRPFLEHMGYFSTSVAISGAIPLGITEQERSALGLGTSEYSRMTCELQPRGNFKVGSVYLFAVVIGPSLDLFVLRQ